ncbi:MAG: hypothetical protein COV29_03075 [Candidatus Yanofskybacteria bacterium CG10_big_fil_rev_8_21_14_0_10_36_16]|uniref:Glycosyltransferase RgtA/B/C/D-like domain-containing protein n=1 Tax=Candidatus Yanofskybacteria bacterium CG10_big_fil_rev_8_21_14_0_10_36_16 TaxID=1975096 RepID=A0A2J0Q713_9BACT|nr:MAG: hypothetical protein COV29_03075 [Candidatus Yanofskybacteria bacterium CG10_big_fil_rev_8_21_14_0_10_36_16]
MRTKSNKNWLVFLGLIALSFVLFGNGIGGDFVFDDKFVITGNPLIGEIAKLPEVFLEPYHFKQPETGLYRPFTIFTHSLNEMIFGESSISFHVVNIFLHAIAAFFVFLVIAQLINRRAGILSAVLFLAMPIHVDAVTSIVGRAELLSAGFVLSALYVSRRHGEDKSQANSQWLSTGLFFLGLLSKEIAIVFLPIWAYIALFYKKEALGGTIKRSVPYLVVLVAYFSIRYIALGGNILGHDGTSVYNPIIGAGILPGFFTALKVMFLYIQKSIIPTSFSSDYSFDQISIVENIFKSPEALIGFLMLGFVIYALLRPLFGVGPDLKINGHTMGILFFFVPFFVISNFVFKTGTIMAERLIYLPSVGLVVLLAICIDNLFERTNYKWRYLGWILLAGLTVFYSVKTIDRNRDWLTENNLYLSAYASAPKSVVNMTNRAYLYTQENDFTSAKELLKETLEMAPEHISALNLLAHINDVEGNKEEAIRLWEKTVELKPTYIRGIRGLGKAYYEIGKLVEAEDVLVRAVELYARWNEVFLLSLTKTKLQKYDEAISVIEDNYGSNPEDLNLKFALGFAYYKMGNPEKADFYFKQARNPELTEEEFFEAVNRL